jgi:copper chaperone
MITIDINVHGMTCAHCQKAVEKAVSTLDGVEKTDVNLESGKVHVTFNETQSTLKDIKKAIEEEGYQVD